MKCDVCGGIVQEGAQFCTNCGAKIEEVAKIDVNNVETSNVGFNQMTNEVIGSNIELNNNSEINNIVNDNFNNVSTGNIEVQNNATSNTVEPNQIEITNIAQDQNFVNAEQSVNLEQSVNVEQFGNVEQSVNAGQNVINNNDNLFANPISAQPNLNENLINNQNVGEVNNNQVNDMNTNYNYQNNVVATENVMSQTGNGEAPEEKANILLAIVSFIIPLVGLIMYFVNKSKKPKTAKACGICALISFILGLVVSIGTMIAIPVMLSGLNNTQEEIEQNENQNTNNDFQDVFSNIILDSDNEGLTEDNSNETTPTTDVSNDWKKYEITVNNKTLVLPTTYNELSSATGFSFESESLKSYLEKNKYTLVNMYKNNKLALYTEILNDGQEDKIYTDCKVTRISQSNYQVTNGADKIVFPGKLTVGESITEQKIIELFGQPTDKKDYKNGDYTSVTYKYNADTTWTTTNYYEIKVVNGIIDELTLDNR